MRIEPKAHYVITGNNVLRNGYVIYRAKDREDAHKFVQKQKSKEKYVEEDKEQR